MGVVKDALTKKYCTFQGRATRKEYWLTALALAAIQLVLFGLLAVVSLKDVRLDYSFAPSDSGLFFACIAIAIVIVIATFIPQLAVSVRRIHDFDVSGLLYLLVLVPYIGAVMYIVFGCVPGTKGPNRFGESSDPDFQSEAYPYPYLPNYNPYDQAQNQPGGYQGGQYQQPPAPGGYQSGQYQQPPAPGGYQSGQYQQPPAPGGYQGGQYQQPPAPGGYQSGQYQPSPAPGGQGSQPQQSPSVPPAPSVSIDKK
jgi:uncharacterized membrane protein YhaH (DUF805 family)